MVTKIRDREQGDLRQKIGPQHSGGGFQTQTERSEQWTVDPFWEMDRPTPFSQRGMLGPSTAPTGQDQYAQIPAKEGEIDCETDQDPSIIEVPAFNWARYVGVKSVQCVKMGHAPKTAAREENNWDLEQVVRETEKNFSTVTDLQLLATETTNDTSLSKTLVYMELQQHDMMKEEYQTHKKKLSSRFGLVLIEDKVIVPKNLPTTIISAPAQRPPRHQQDDAGSITLLVTTKDRGGTKETCNPCKMSGKNIRRNIPNTETYSLPLLNSPNEESNWVPLDQSRKTTVDSSFYCPFTRFSKWPVASFCTSTDEATVVNFLEQYSRLNGIPKTIRADEATAITGRLFRGFC